MKWNTRILKVGSDVKELFVNTKRVDFRPNDRETDLADYSVIYDQRPTANWKLKERGTCTFDFSGKREPSGTVAIMLSGVGFADKCLREGNKIIIK